MKTTYFVGETVDFTGAKLFETFTNGGAEVEITDLSKLTYDYDAATVTATAGEKQILATYNGASAGTVKITVKNPAITETVLDKSGLTTDYMVGDTVSLEGLSVTLTYENGESRTVESFTAVTNLAAIAGTTGEKDVHIKFNDPISGAEQTASFKIKVDGVKNYTVNTENVTLEYYEGEDVSFAGIKVMENYYYAASKEIAFADLTFVHAANITATAGNKQVEIKLGDTVISSFNIKVGDIPGVVLNTAGVDLSYRVGETVSLAGLTGTVTYKDDATKNFAITLSDLTVVSNLSTLTATGGDKTVTVKYMLEGDIEILSDFTLTVYAPSYSVDTSGAKTVYIAGDTVSFDGIKVYANYEDGGESVLVDLSRVTFMDTAGVTATVGNKTVLMYLDGGTAAFASYQITVEKNVIEKMEIKGEPDTVYKKGESASFTGVSILLTYKNGATKTVSFADLTITGADTAKVGKQTVKLAFTDPINNEDALATLDIEVLKETIVNGFSDSDAVTEFKNDNKAPTKVYGDTGFNTQFENTATYLIGDDNAFILVPKLNVTEEGVIKTLAAFYSEVTVSVKNGSSYKALTATPDSAEPTEVAYYDGETLIVTVDTYYGSYQFTPEAVGKEIKISVLPSAEHYTMTNIAPVTLEAKVIDAYNVYNAKQLSVIDNAQEEWNGFKEKEGLAGITPAGIVLHNDIHISEKDVPDSFFYTSSKKIVYTNSVSGEPTTVPAGTKFLIDGTFIYRRANSTEDFTLQGNFFTVDIADFPLVPTPVAYDSCGGPDTEHGYWSDFSNATVFVFEYNEDNWDGAPAKRPQFTVDNLHFIGNAGRNNLVDAKGDLVSAGGLIFMKVRNYADATVSNTNVVSCFIAFIPDMDSTLLLDTLKCYDSYQNALFVWGETVCTVKDSYLVGSGGPVAIVDSVYRDEHDPQWDYATLKMENTVSETLLTGEELWFVALKATPIVQDQVKPLLVGLSQVGHPQLGYTDQFLTDKGEMNIVAALITDMGSGGSDLTALVGNAALQGEVTVNGGGIERWQTSETWLGIYSHPAFASGAPFLTVTDANGTDHTIFFNGTTFCDMQGNALGASHVELLSAFVNAEYLTLSQGGLTVVFEAVK